MWDKIRVHRDAGQFTKTHSLLLNAQKPRNRGGAEKRQEDKRWFVGHGQVSPACILNPASRVCISPAKLHTPRSLSQCCCALIGSFVQVKILTERTKFPTLHHCAPESFLLLLIFMGIHSRPHSVCVFSPFRFGRLSSTGSCTSR